MPAYHIRTHSEAFIHRNICKCRDKLQIQIG